MKAVPDSALNYDDLPGSALVDIKTVKVIFGRSSASVWRDVKAGRLPKPIKAGPRSTRWRVSELRAVQQQQAA